MPNNSLSRFFWSSLCLSLLVISLISLSGALHDCSEAICGPRVSKCMLIKSCNCSMMPGDLEKNDNCSCCKDCFRCLGEQFQDCCSCVGLCRPKQIDPRNAMQSYIDDLHPEEDERRLFATITADDGHELGDKWTVSTFPMLQNTFFYEQRSQEQDKTMDLLKGVNCTVMYMNECLSLDKCRRFCGTVGASRYRWFFSGCCECVGESCINYGSRENLCKSCIDDLYGNDVHRKEL